MRYRLQVKETIARPNILGNHSMPVYSYRWRDLYASDDKEALEQMIPDNENYRIEDTRRSENEQENNR